MNGHRPKKQIDVARLKADLAAAGVELLSAQCAADRLRLCYSPQDIVAFGERQSLQRAIASAEALYRFFSTIEAQASHLEGPNPESPFELCIPGLRNYYKLYFSTRINSPVDALTATVNLAPSRLDP